MIGKEGEIKKVWNNVEVKGHVDDVLVALEG